MNHKLRLACTSMLLHDAVLLGRLAYLQTNFWTPAIQLCVFRRGTHSSPQSIDEDPKFAGTDCGRLRIAAELRFLAEPPPTLPGGSAPIPDMQLHPNFSKKWYPQQNRFRGVVIEFLNWCDTPPFLTLLVPLSYGLSLFPVSSSFHFLFSLI